MDAGRPPPRDAATDAPQPDSGGPREEDAGHDQPAADSGRAHPRIRPREKAGCKLFGPLFANDHSWALARCGDQIGRLALTDLAFDARGEREGELIEAALALDHVLYIDQFTLKTLPLAGGAPKRLWSDVYGINALTPDRRHAVVEAKDDHGGYYHQLFDVAGVETPIKLSAAGSEYWFKAISADGSRVFLRNVPADKPGRVRSIQIAGGVATELGDAVLSNDAMKFAVLDAATGNITVSGVDGAALTTWHEAGYMPTRIVSFTRDASTLILDDADGSRAVAVDGSKSVRLTGVTIAPWPSLHMGSAALFRWCLGSCMGNSGRFNLVPLDGRPAQSREVDNCYGVSGGTDSARFSESGERAVFLDPQQEIVLADASAAMLSVIAKDVGRPCYPASYGISADGSKVFVTGSFGVRIVDASGTLLGSFPGADAPVFSPSTRRVSMVMDDALQIIELSTGEVLYRATVTGDLSTQSSDPNKFAWVDEERFIYDDGGSIYLVQL